MIRTLKTEAYTPMRAGFAVNILAFLGQTTLHPTLPVETDIFSHYEPLSYVAVKTRRKRSGDQVSLEKEVEFSSFGRIFRLQLTSGSPVLAKGFRARTVNADGSSDVVHIDQSNLFTGRVVGDENSEVSAHLEGELWSMQISEIGETYGVEPAWRLLNAEQNPDNHTMVAYRLSDIKSLPADLSFCSSVLSMRNTSSATAKNREYGNASFAAREKYGSVGQKLRREKRHVRDTCLMYVAGDTDFFINRCRRSVVTCTALMLHYVQSADKIYRRSKFENRINEYTSGIGLQVKDLVLFTEYSGAEDEKYAFNVADKVWHSEMKLNAFSKFVATHSQHYTHKHSGESEDPSFCLYHLFTDLSDKRGILGRAFTDVLCGWPHNPTSMLLNTGLTSGTNKMGYLLPTGMMSIVFTHEVGHNFGANHDPDTNECAPEDNLGGKYVMWAFAVRGLSQNNRKFSHCSLRSIGRALAETGCFVARSEQLSFCGNGVVDAGEECDAGAVGSASEDPCCDNRCMLHNGAVCSDANKECCKDCQIAPASTLCRRSGYILNCVNDSYCPGDDTSCPEGEILPDGTECGARYLQGFECRSGRCEGPCKLGTRYATDGTILKPCFCDDVEVNKCKWCCFNATDPEKPGMCRPASDILKSDGLFCAGGVCKDGECVKDVYLKQSRIGSYIDLKQYDLVIRFFRQNIVLDVVALSLIVWVPISIVIHRADCRERARRDDLLNLLIAVNRFYRHEIEEDNHGREAEILIGKRASEPKELAAPEPPEEECSETHSMCSIRFEDDSESQTQVIGRSIFRSSEV